MWRNMRYRLAITALIVSCFSALAITPYGVQLLEKPNAISARAYLGVTNAQNGIVAGTNITFGLDTFGRVIISSTGGGGSGTVTTVSVGNLSPIFTSAVSNASTAPAVTFSLSSQSAHTFFAGPTSGGAAAPTFRAILSNDIPVVAEATLAGTVPASGITGGPISKTVSGSLTNHSDVTTTPLSVGDVLVWNGSAWVNAQTNSGGGSGTTVADFMSMQTNKAVTFRQVDGSVTRTAPAWTGFGDQYVYSGGGGSRSVFDSSNGGIWNEANTSASANNAVFLANTAINSLPFDNGTSLYFQCFYSMRNTNAVRQYVGVDVTTLATIAGNDTNNTGVFALFRYSTSANDATWMCVASDGTTQFTTNTGIAVSPDRQYFLTISKNDSLTNLTFTINRTNSFSFTNHVPNASGTLMTILISTTTLDNSAKTNRVRYIGTTFNYYTP